MPSDYTATTKPAINQPIKTLANQPNNQPSPGNYCEVRQKLKNKKRSVQ